MSPGEFRFMAPGDSEVMGEGTDTMIPGEEAIMLDIFNGDGHGENICAAVSGK